MGFDFTPVLLTSRCLGISLHCFWYWGQRNETQVLFSVNAQTSGEGRPRSYSSLQSGNSCWSHGWGGDDLLGGEVRVIKDVYVKYSGTTHQMVAIVRSKLLHSAEVVYQEMRADGALLQEHFSLRVICERE